MAATDVARTNGNTNGASPEAPPRIVLQQLSFSGTERGHDGIIRPDEYVWELADPIARMEKFEEMGNDDAIAKALQARMQEINAANWTLTTKDESEDGQRRLRFAEDNLYPFLEPLLRHFGRYLQYGFTLVEPVYRYSDAPFFDAIARGKVSRPAERTGERQLRLWKIAHIRPQAVTAFKTTETGDLTSVQQRVFTGSQMIDREIPPDKLLLLVYDKQGDDFYGQPPMRRCYKPWRIKTQLEKLGLLHNDRFGVGIPIVKEPAQGFTPSDRALVNSFLQAMRAGATNAMTLPNGSVFEIATGVLGMYGAMLEGVKLYNLQIAGIFGTQQTELGSTETGSRAVGETHDEQRQSVSQADAEQIASVINNGLVVKLIDMNFGKPENGIYPIFTPSLRQRGESALPVDLAALTAAGFLHPEPEDEVNIRDRYELAEIPLEDLKQRQEERDAKAADIAKQAADAAKANAPDARDNEDAPPKPRPRIAATRMLAAGAPDGPQLTPERHAWILATLRPEVVIADLDRQATRLSDEVREALQAIDENLAEQAKAAAESGPDAARRLVKSIAVPDKLRRELKRVMLDAAERARDYGETTVRNEVERQLAPVGIGPQRSPRIPSLAPSSSYAAQLGRAVLRLLRAADVNPRDAHLEAEVERAANEEIRRREGATEWAITSAIAQAGSSLGSFVSALVTGIKDALFGLSPNKTEANVQGVVNVAFGVGRADQAEALVEKQASGGGGRSKSGLRDANGNAIELTGKIYSAVMDLGTCDECAKWDGGEFPIDYPEDMSGVQTPNPRCAGGYARCRCVWIYKTAEESTPNVGPSKGPET